MRDPGRCDQRRRNAAAGTVVALTVKFMRGTGNPVLPSYVGNTGTLLGGVLGERRGQRHYFWGGSSSS